MFGGPPPPPSKAELKAQEDAANSGLRFAFITCAFLYIAPHAVDYASKFI